MKNLQIILFVFMLLAGGDSAYAGRDTVPMNSDWHFRFSHDVERSSGRRVDLPHTWNAQDALKGEVDYKRGIGNYTKLLFVQPEWQGRRLFLRFEGANSVTNVFVNGKHVGEHRGGYGAFVFEITDWVEYGCENVLLVRVNNGEQLDVMPLVGDFNFYGGIYRDVHLLMTEKVCISLLDYASPGVYLIQKSVSERKADVCARVMLSNASTEQQKAEVKLAVYDGKRIVCEAKKAVTIDSGAAAQATVVDFTFVKPRLWNGTADPHLYTAIVTLERSGVVLDSIVQPLGLRYYATDPARGFFLNGKHLPLRGVCRHQERAEVGSALHAEHHEEDVELMCEMGVNAVRLAHYPQDTYIYNILDRYGMVVWAEIPFVGPGGYGDAGFVNLPAFRENGREQLRELIRQHYNHPSICFWGLFNELTENGDNPVEYLCELNALAHEEDPTRPTVAASNQDGVLNFITDNIAWNRYDGWYGATPATLAEWLDQTHAAHPELRIGISEYGAGASIYQQQDSLAQSVPTSWWHPENWQTEYHIRNWEIISARPYVWSSFVWNMFDFGAAHRREGDRPGINDKGLVTHDRKVRKDAFYFYKANWNQEPMVYVAGRRNKNRTKSVADVLVFSNCREVTLCVNGRTIGMLKPDSLQRCLFEGVVLDKGPNELEATAKTEGGVLSDSCRWVLSE